MQIPIFILNTFDVWEEVDYTDAPQELRDGKLKKKIVAKNCDDIFIPPPSFF